MRFFNRNSNPNPEPAADSLETNNTGTRSSRNYPNYDQVHACTQNDTPWGQGPGTHCRTCGRPPTTR